MIEYLNQYRELLLELEEERNLLQNYEDTTRELQENFTNIENNINKLTQEQKELERNLTEIINSKLNKTNKYLILTSTIIIIFIEYITAILSNFDIGIIFSGFIVSSLSCIYINNIINNRLTKVYKKKDPFIKEVQNKIKENKLLLLKYRKDKTSTFNDKVNNNINYNNQKQKVQKIEKQINNIKIEYATPIFNKELDNISNKKPLTRIKQQ